MACSFITCSHVQHNKHHVHFVFFLCNYLSLSLFFYFLFLSSLLAAGQGIHETTEDGESLLSLACSAGYFELAEVLLRMRASVEDKGMKGGCVFTGVVDTPTLLGDSTPLMEAASGGYVDIIKLLIEHGAKVNATSR